MAEATPDPNEAKPRPAPNFEGQKPERASIKPGAPEWRQARAGGKSYTARPLPDDTSTLQHGERKKPRSRWLLVAVVAATLAVSGFVWKQDSLPHWAHPWTAVQQEQVLTLTPADIDYAATDAARAALARGEIPAVLANADAATRQNILSGKDHLYTKQLLQQNEQGILVHARVSTGGVFLGEDLLTSERPQGTTFPAGPDAPTHFHFTVEQAGPAGAVTCWVRSANGGVVTTQPMPAGASADLEVVAQ
jgi:hypothetical protein